MTIAIVCADFIRRAAKVRHRPSDDDVRPNIEGVQIEPCPGGGVLVVAANGHAIIVLRDVEWYADGPVLITPSNRMLAACVERLSDTGTRRMVVNGKAGAVVVSDAAPSNEERRGEILGSVEKGARVRLRQDVDFVSDAVFPGWRNAVPPASAIDYAARVPHHSPLVLAPLSEALTRDDGTANAATFASKDRNGPVFVIPWLSNIDGFGVIMPLYVPDHLRQPLPTWWTQ